MNKKPFKGISFAKDVRIIDVPAHPSINMEAKRKLGDRNTSYGTESILRGKYEKAKKSGIGKAELIGMFRKY